jgi:hypothetical protein
MVKFPEFLGSPTYIIIIIVVVVVVAAAAGAAIVIIVVFSIQLSVLLCSEL